VKKFFEPQSVAVVGASRDPRKDGYVILNNLIDSFSGKIFPVNPNTAEICGLRAYPSLLDIPDKVDLAIIIVPARIVPSIMEDCAKKGIERVIIEGMGFAEIGSEGKKLQDKIVEVAVNNGIRVIGPNCTGIVSRGIVTTFFRIRDVPDGNVTMIGQSGLLAAGMAADIVANGTLNIRKFCSIGNKCDVNENDLLEYFGKDDATAVISIYLESFVDGQRFVEIATQVTRKKPVIVLYGGRSGAGAKAAKSHTGSIASNAKVVDAALKQSMCIKADDFNELIEFARVFSTQPIPQGNRVAVVTAAGSVGVVVSDLCESHGLRLATLSKDTVAKLRKIFPEWLQPSNPVDLWFTIEQLGYTRALTESMEAVLSDPEIDCVILVIAGFQYSAELVEKRAVQQTAAKYGKPVIVCMLVGEKKYKDLVQEKLGREIPVFASLTAGVKPLSKLCEYGIRARRSERDVQHS
jgi:acetyltransferase